MCVIMGTDQVQQKKSIPSCQKHLGVGKSFLWTLSRGQKNRWLCEGKPPTLLAAGRSQTTATRTTWTRRAKGGTSLNMMLPQK